MDVMVLLATVWAVLVPASTVPTPARGYVWPFDPRPDVVRGYDAPPQPWAAGHRGADLLGRVGQPVLAAGDGVVLFRGVVAGRGVLTVAHPNGWRTTYEPVTSGVAVGTPVRAGQQIATLTDVQSHCAPRVCLHWGLLVTPDVYRDPLTLLQARVPVLIPLSS